MNAGSRFHLKAVPPTSSLCFCLSRKANKLKELSWPEGQTCCWALPCTAQFGSARHGTTSALHGTALHGSALYGTAWHRMAWHGSALRWHCMVLHGTAWLGAAHNPLLQAGAARTDNRSRSRRGPARSSKSRDLMGITEGSVSEGTRPGWVRGGAGCRPAPGQVRGV